MGNKIHRWSDDARKNHTWVDEIDCSICTTLSHAPFVNDIYVQVMTVHPDIDIPYTTHDVFREAQSTPRSLGHHTYRDVIIKEKSKHTDHPYASEQHTYLEDHTTRHGQPWPPSSAPRPTRPVHPGSNPPQNRRCFFGAQLTRVCHNCHHRPIHAPLLPIHLHPTQPRRSQRPYGDKHPSNHILQRIPDVSPHNQQHTNTDLGGDF